MNRPSPLVLLILGMIAFILLLSVFTVRQTQTAIIARFGEIKDTIYGPGLHFKIPLIDKVRKFDTRILTLDTKSSRFLTKEKKNLIVDSFVKWRVANPRLFYITVAGDPVRANQRLDQVINDGLRGEFGIRELKEVVSGDRQKIVQKLLDETRKKARENGIEVVDVRLKRVDLPPEVSESVFNRMRSERERVARDFRSRGQEEAERIRADADRQSTVHLANAYRDAEALRGQGDALAADIYARAFGKDTEFFRLYRSLNAYRKSFGGNDNVIVLQPKNSEFLQYFNQPKPQPQ